MVVIARRLALACAFVVSSTFLLVACGGGGGKGGEDPSVLLVVAMETEFQNDLISKLQAFNRFSAIDLFDATTGSPTLQQLLDYDSVLVSKDIDFIDRVALGNALADYVDQGGGVVLAQFVFEGGAHPSGRFETAGYTIISNGFFTEGDGPFGYFVVNQHPILDNVTTFNGGTSSYRPAGAGIAPGSTLVATWNDPGSTPLVATRIIGTARRCDLGFFPVTSDSGRTDFVQANTDAMRIVANALRWVAGDL